MKKSVKTMEIISMMNNYRIRANFFADFINDFFNFIEAIQYDLQNDTVRVFIYEDAEADIPFFLERHGLL